MNIYLKNVIVSVFLNLLSLNVKNIVTFRENGKFTPVYWSVNIICMPQFVIYFCYRIAKRCSWTRLYLAVEINSDFRMIMFEIVAIANQELSVYRLWEQNLSSIMYPLFQYFIRDKLKHWIFIKTTLSLKLAQLIQ